MLCPKASPLDLDFGLCARAKLFNNYLSEETTSYQRKYFTAKRRLSCQLFARWKYFFVKLKIYFERKLDLKNNFMSKTIFASINQILYMCMNHSLCKKNAWYVCESHYFRRNILQKIQDDTKCRLLSPSAVQQPPEIIVCF